MMVKKFSDFILEDLDIDSQIHTGEDRYNVVLQFHIWASSEDEAKAQAEAISKAMDTQYDNSPNVVSVTPNFYGKV